MDAPSRIEMLESAAAAIKAVHAGNTRVHCLTNTVAQTFTANVLLAAGAIPSMTVAPDEAGQFAARSDAVLINLGTLDADRRGAMSAVADHCNETDKPWVLDPVMCHRSEPRKRFALGLLNRTPTILRINQDEAESLGQAAQSARTRVVTGAVDRLEGQGVAVGCANGDPLLAKVTAIGCAQGALMAALSASATAPYIAALAALLWLNIAAEDAAIISKGPGSFAANLLDAVHNFDPSHLPERAKLL